MYVYVPLYTLAFSGGSTNDGFQQSAKDTITWISTDMHIIVHNCTSVQLYSGATYQSKIASGNIVWSLSVTKVKSTVSD